MFENSVIEKIILGNECVQDKSTVDIHVAFGITSNFIRPVGVLITSILKNSRDCKIAFHIFVDGNIPQEDKERLERLVQVYTTEIIIYIINNNIFLI